MGKFGFGELELFILKIVQEKGRTSVRDVYNSLGRKGGYTTVMTVMSRLVKKGELSREREGRQYVYWIEAKNQIPSKNILSRIRKKIFGGNSTAMVSYLLAEEDVSEQELAEIEALIQRRRREKVDG